MLQLSVAKPDWTKQIAELELDMATKAELILESIRVEVIAYLRSLTDELRPPLRRSARTGRLYQPSVRRGKDGSLRQSLGTEPPRRAHPGHWADVTSQLALSYEGEVQRIPGGARLILRNGAEYAAALEARDGFFVLSGVAEAGGPIDQALAVVVPRVAPGMHLERLD